MKSIYRITCFPKIFDFYNHQPSGLIWWIYQNSYSESYMMNFKNRKKSFQNIIR